MSLKLWTLNSSFLFYLMTIKTKFIAISFDTNHYVDKQRLYTLSDDLKVGEHLSGGVLWEYLIYPNFSDQLREVTPITNHSMSL